MCGSFTPCCAIDRGRGRFDRSTYLHPPPADGIPELLVGLVGRFEPEAH